MTSAERVTALGASLDYLLQLQQDQLAAWASAGKPPTFSVDGESYSWGSWLAEIDAAIDAKIGQRQKVSGPFIVRTKGRA